MSHPEDQHFALPLTKFATARTELKTDEMICMMYMYYCYGFILTPVNWL
jgi:hypothetical protein